MADGNGAAYSLRSDWSDRLSIKLFANGQLLIWFTNVIGFAQKAIMSQQTRMDNFFYYTLAPFLKLERFLYHFFKIQPQFILIGWKNNSQNIYFCVSKKKQSYTGLQQHLNFWVNYPFKICSFLWQNLIRAVDIRQRNMPYTPHRC